MNIKTNFKNVSIAILLGAFTGISSLLHADDTDIYLGAGTTDPSIRPNILFILDTSGSMGSTVSGTGKSRLANMQDAVVQILQTTSNVNVGLMTFNSRGGPVRYPVAYIDENSSIVENGGFPVVNPIKDSADDVEEDQDTNPGQMDLTDPVLHFTDDLTTGGTTSITVQTSSADGDDAEQWSGGNNIYTTADLDMGEDAHVGIIFRNLNIPQGSTIISAEMDLKGYSDKTEPTSLHIVGEGSVTAFPFDGGSASNISERLPGGGSPNITAASVTWNVPAVDNNQDVTSPDLRSIVQELVGTSGVNPYGWANDGTNNTVTILVDRNQSTGHREFDAESASGSDQPVLRVTYANAIPPVASEQKVGLRFQDVRIPQGARIRQAQIVFTAAADAMAGTSSQSDLDIDISAELVDDSSAFTTTNGDLSARGTTTADVQWDLDETDAGDDWTVDQTVISPDLTAVVQEIVDQGGWCGGKSLSFILEGSGERSVYSFDGLNNTNLDRAPTLQVDYDPDVSTFTGTGCTVMDFTARVATGNDDAEEYSSGYISRTSGDLELVYDGSNQTVGMRFINLGIPQGSSIKDAYLEFTADNSHSGTTNLTIRGHNVDDSPGFSTSNSNISNRLSTATSSIAWNNVSSWSTGNTYQSPSITTIVQEIVNRPGWSPNNAMTMIITGSGRREAESYNGIPGAAPRLVVQATVDLATAGLGSSDTVRQRLIQEVSDLNLVAGTPTVDTLYEAARYFRGNTLDWGSVRGAQYSYDRYGRVSHPSTYTGGSVFRPSGCDDTNLDSSNCRNETVTGGTYQSPIDNACQVNHIVILSDGYQNTFYRESQIESMIGQGCSASSGGADCGYKLAEYLNTVDQSTSLPGDQTITTHTIGFNFSTTFLSTLAQRGGGGYYTATTASQLVSVFQSIVNQILAHTTSFTAPAVAVNQFNRLFHKGEVYLALFQPSAAIRWNGNVKKYSLCLGLPSDSCNTGDILDANGIPAIDDVNRKIKDTAESLWNPSAVDGSEITLGGSGEKVPEHDDIERVVYTYTGSVDPNNTSLNATSHRVLTSNSALTDTLLGSSGDRNNLIQWIRGENIDGQSTTKPSPSTDRWSYGDPLHSSPLAISYDTNVSKLIHGSNDGGIHMIDANTGIEDWVFFPQETLSKQKDLRQNADGQHIYGVDLPPTVWSNNLNGDDQISGPNEFVYAYFGMRRGGRNIYALNITPDGGVPTNPINPVYMWRIEGGTGDFQRLGYSWSQPKHAKIYMKKSGGGSEIRDVLIFGGGYDEAVDTALAASNTGNAIYIVDATTGDRLLWISNVGSGADIEARDMDFPIPNEVTIYDSNGDGVQDRLYATDVAGQIWRVDLGSDIEQNNRGATLLDKLAAIGDTSLTPTIAEQRHFYNAADVVQVSDSTYSNTTKYDLVLIASGHRANPLRDDIHNHIMAFRDYNIDGLQALSSSSGVLDTYTELTLNDLYDATDNLIQDGSTGQQATALSDLQNSDGWYIELQDSGSWIGEKGLSRGVTIAGKFFVTTFIPTSPTGGSGACTVDEGQGRLYGLDILNAGAVINWDESNSDLTKGDRTYQLGGGIPSAPTPVFLPGGLQLLIGGGSQENVSSGESLARYKTYWSEE